MAKGVGRHVHHDGYIGNYLRTGKGKILGVGSREVVARRKDGSTVLIELSINQTGVENESRFIGVIGDITVRKRMEEQLHQTQRMDAIGSLTGGIAHDFNNILSVLLGNLQLLEHGTKPDDEQTLAMAGAAIAATLRGADLIRQLLAFSRRQELETRTLDVNALVAGMDKLLRRTIASSIEISTKLDPNITQAKADPAQLEAALLNLAINASHAMPNGGKLLIETSNAEFDEAYAASHAETRPGAYVCVSFTDTGTGIAKEHLGKIFDPFFTTKEVGKGTGLGLAMVFGFAKQTGGHINVYSEAGHGTRFRLYLPATDEAGARLTVAAAGRPAGRSETVLVVEDQDQVRDTAVMMLRHLGYSVISAEDGPRGIEALNRSPKVDLLLTDMVMPGGMTGHDVASQAQEQRPGMAVLLASGYPRDAFAEGGRKFPLLSKPYSLDSLARMVRQALGGSPDEHMP